jgi:uncharacterized integral membrane protein (TIGR00698 family)
MNPVMWALLGGIVVGNIFTLPEKWSKWVGLASTTLLEYSIVMMAFGINYANFGKTGWLPFLGIVIIVLAVLWISFHLSRKFNCPGSTGVLVGFGTAICGSSAIAALAPSIKNQEKEDVAIAMAVVNLLGTIGMLAIPIALMDMNWLNEKIGFFIGASLHSVGNVAGAGYAISEEAGNAAIAIKMARVAMLTPGLIFIKFLINKGENISLREQLKLPKYLIAFVIITIIASFIEIPKEILSITKFSGEAFLTVAMAAIGLKVSFTKLLNAGQRGLKFGLVIFAIQLALVVGIWYLVFGIW